MTIAGAVAGFLAALAAFWLIGRLTGNNWYAMAGGAGRVLFRRRLRPAKVRSLEIFFDGFSYPYFPGFRRYIPAIGDGRVLCVCWHWSGSWSTANVTRRRIRESVLILQSSALARHRYLLFFVSPTASFHTSTSGQPRRRGSDVSVLIWLIERPDGWKRISKICAIVAASVVLLSLIPYAYLLSKRSDTMDDVQLLVRTHAPDLFRFPEYISFVVLISADRRASRQK